MHERNEVGDVENSKEEEKRGGEADVAAMRTCKQPGENHTLHGSRDSRVEEARKLPPISRSKPVLPNYATIDPYAAVVYCSSAGKDDRNDENEVPEVQNVPEQGYTLQCRHTHGEAGLGFWMEITWRWSWTIKEGFKPHMRGRPFVLDMQAISLPQHHARAKEQRVLGSQMKGNSHVTTLKLLVVESRGIMRNGNFAGIALVLYLEPLVKTFVEIKVESLHVDTTHVALVQCIRE